jgi:hypothetical protein
MIIQWDKFTIKGTNLSRDFTEILYHANFDVIPLLNRLSKIKVFFSIDSGTYVVASPSMLINLESFKKYFSTLTPKDPGVFLVKTTSNQPLLKRRRSVQNWIIF